MVTRWIRKVNKTNQKRKEKGFKKNSNCEKEE